MTPVIRHLRKTFSYPILQEEEINSDYYRKIIPFHLVLNLEYSLLGQRLTSSLQKQINKKQIEDQLNETLMLAKLLEYIYQNYLIVPREVERLRKHQRTYCRLLTQITGCSYEQWKNTEPVVVGLSFSQQIRNTTLNSNWYRLLLIRCKRVLDAVDALGTGSLKYRQFVGVMDKYANPVLSYLGWCYYLPRLLVNLFLVLKHTIPGFWMGEEEKSLGWTLRFKAQMQRRWFELGNDIAWVTIGLLNCFLFTGMLSPIATYLTVIFYGYDVGMAAYRAYLELTRLYDLQKQYAALDIRDEGEDYKKELADYQVAISQRIHFEKIRLAHNVATTAAIFITMSFAIPALAINPIIPLIGAVALVLVCLVSFTLLQILEKYRPKDTIDPDFVLSREPVSAIASPKEPAIAIARLGIFAQKIESNTRSFSAGAKGGSFINLK